MAPSLRPSPPKRGRGNERITVNSLAAPGGQGTPRAGQPHDSIPSQLQGPGKLIGARADSLWHLGIGILLLAILRFGPVSSYPGFRVCGFHWLTGRPCPLCGMTRAFVCLTKGDWLMALRFNILSPLLFGMLLATMGSALLRFLAIEISYPADLGLRRAQWGGVCLTLFAVYGLLRICRLVP